MIGLTIFTMILLVGYVIYWRKLNKESESLHYSEFSYLQGRDLKYFLTSSKGQERIDDIIREKGWLVVYSKIDYDFLKINSIVVINTNNFEMNKGKLYLIKTNHESGRDEYFIKLKTKHKDGTFTGTRNNGENIKFSSSSVIGKVEYSS